ncbi:hypothetical protein RT99_23475 [Flavobacterium sp. MEB061]|uniref:DUF2806 domain-containing protein n=1 Tax=Flavobacterium sp. MEB061 TaxID=1587524 RepID=UPI0005ACA3A4|nr:DUF2806 domain-containing protein [Flavobacterium sp. MEB061]KIQ14777.1 hypothetical protein RT99_23475 [Flavobacterium sp. MEB061]
MGLITFEGKPIEKLIEVISQGIGTLYRPRAIKKEADAEAYKIQVLEKAKTIANTENKLIEFDTLSAIEQKILFQEQRKQNNIENIIEVAVEQIIQEPNVNSENIDQDWITRFFKIAEDISNDEMQKLWGRILSGEVKQPGSFSLRTLNLLKDLNKQEAEIFTKFAQLNVKYNAGHFIPFIDINYFEEQLNIPYSEILLMIELGLLTSGTSIGLNFPALKESVRLLYEIGETGIHVTTSAHNKPHSLPILAFTKIALELSTLIPIEINLEYVTYVCKALSTPNTKIIVGTIINEEGQNRFKTAFEYNP